VSQEVQPVHHEAQVGAGFPCAGVGSIRLRAAPRPKKSLREGKQLVVTPESPEEPAGAVGPAPGASYESQRGSF
jgi:hypothetical protein